jgi:DNA-binding HxlR family transcriptional regulator
MAMCLRYQCFNRADDVVVSGATTDVAGQVVANFAFGRIRVLLKQLADAHDHSRRAEAALQCVMFLKGRLNRMQPIRWREALNRRDRRPVGHNRKNRAGFDGQAIDINSAGAALRGVATDVGPGQTEIVAQEMNQEFAWLNRNAAAVSVDVDCHFVSFSVSFGHGFLNGCGFRTSSVRQNPDRLTNVRCSEKSWMDLTGSYSNDKSDKESSLMKSKSFDGMVCSIARALETIGDRWAILILRDLSLGLSRYEDLRQSSGITHATLSDRLKHLEENDLIERRQYQSNPERYEYVLTRKGRDTRLLTQALVQIGDKWAVAVDQRPPLKFVDRKTGRAVKLALVDAETEETVKTRDVIPHEGPGADDLIRWRLTYLKK